MKNLRRFLSTLCLLAFGILPSLVLFVWIERNMALPWVGTWIGWPWIYLDGGLAASITFDLALIAGFGIIHSALAGRAPRRAYVVVAGITSFVVMAAWQSTGIILYQLIRNAVATSVVSFVLYWGFLAFAYRALSAVESPLRFAGVTAKSENGGPSRLWTGGIYAHVRHPLYTITLAAWILTPMMSLDRAVFVAGMSAYLFFGIRREERRIAAEFGAEYADYRARTPMLLPRFSRAS